MAPEYPDIEPQHLIIDNVAHQMAKDPAQFDVIVTTNLAGDIISDLASGLVGGLGFAASGNYGDDVAIFEAVHGSAPKYAGKNVINPTALILSSVMMLRHIGEPEAAAQQIEDAVFVTLEEGKAVTLDVARQAGATWSSRPRHRASPTRSSRTSAGHRRCATRRKAESAARLAAGAPGELEPAPGRQRRTAARRRGRLHRDGRRPAAVVGKLLDEAAGPEFKLLLMSARGTKVYPDA